MYTPGGPFAPSLCLRLPKVLGSLAFGSPSGLRRHRPDLDLTGAAEPPSHRSLLNDPPELRADRAPVLGGGPSPRPLLADPGAASSLDLDLDGPPTPTKSAFSAFSAAVSAAFSAAALSALTRRASARASALAASFASAIRSASAASER